MRRALAPDSDSVVYQDRVVHVASYAQKFLFTSEQLNQPVERLSGGERARVLIAKLMLEPADLLLLDEPTNDLDIATLEILEESLLEYTGALVLVTHDRYMLDRVSTTVLGLDGKGDSETFADYPQWEQWRGVKLEEPIAPGTDREGIRLEASAVGKRPSLSGRRSFRIWRLGSMQELSLRLRPLKKASGSAGEGRRSDCGDRRGEVDRGVSGYGSRAGGGGSPLCAVG